MFLYKVDEQEIKLTSCTSEHKVFSEEKTSRHVDPPYPALTPSSSAPLVLHERFLLQTLIKEEVKVSVAFTALR